MSINITDNKVTCSVDVVAQYVGLTARQVQNLEKSRVILRKARGVYDLEASVVGYCNYLRGNKDASGQGATDDQGRLTAAKAGIAELDLSEREGDLIRASGVDKMDFSLGRILRNNLQSIPDRLAALLAAENDGAVCHRMILEEVNKSLESVIKSMGETEIDAGELDITRKTSSQYLDESLADGSQEKSTD
jgi:phage terminase Nu1 subunit (DNA packaging protein)